jgi:parallel beta-helix repeat protein
MWKNLGVIVVIASTMLICTSVNGQSSLEKLSTTATILYVGGNGPGNYSSIQEAINDSTPGGTIYVYPGNYSEKIIVDRPLALLGLLSGEQKPILYHPWAPQIIANNCTFQNFSIGKVESWFSITSDSTLVRDCEITAWVRYKYGSYNRFLNNTVSICVLLLEGSHNNTISGNTIINTHDNIYQRYGIDVRYSNGNIITNNAFSRDWRGVHLYESNNTTVRDNEFFGSGLSIEGKTNPHFSSHTIQGNHVENKSIYYYLNAESISVPPDCGEAIFVNSRDCIMENMTLPLSDTNIIIYNSTNITVRNTNFSWPWLGIYIDSSSYITVDHIRIIGQHFAIQTINTNHITISNNQLQDCAITASTTNHAIISNNTLLRDGMRISGDNNSIQNNYLEQGSLDSLGDYNEISYNTIKNFSDDGINTMGAYFNVTHNTVDHGDNGIYCKGLHSIYQYNLIKHCNIGINLQYGNNYISHNTITINKYGIYTIWPSRNNAVEYNNLLLNTRDAVIKNVVRNSWRHNYWDFPRFLPKIIIGTYDIFYGGPFNYDYFTIPIMNMDPFPSPFPIKTN